jgi:hypothetical protein
MSIYPKDNENVEWRGDGRCILGAPDEGATLGPSACQLETNGNVATNNITDQEDEFWASFLFLSPRQ